MEAVKYFLSGYSCSESIIKEAIDLGLCDESMLAIATPFSGGMQSGCLCGAIAGAQMVIGNLYGRENKYGNEAKAKELAKTFIDGFKKHFPATCCKVLTRGLDMQSAERKQHCAQMVEYCSKELQNLISTKV